MANFSNPHPLIQPFAKGSNLRFHLASRLGATPFQFQPHSKCLFLRPSRSKTEARQGRVRNTVTRCWTVVRPLPETPQSTTMVRGGSSFIEPSHRLKRRTLPSPKKSNHIFLIVVGWHPKMHLRRQLKSFAAFGEAPAMVGHRLLRFATGTRSVARRFPSITSKLSKIQHHLQNCKNPASSSKL